MFADLIQRYYLTKYYKIATRVRKSCYKNGMYPLFFDDEKILIETMKVIIETLKG